MIKKNFKTNIFGQRNQREGGKEEQEEQEAKTEARCF